MQRILVPTDFSATATKAFRFALDIASKSGGVIYLYHVYAPLENTFIDTELKRKEYNEKVQVDLSDRLKTLNKSETANMSVTVTTVLGRTPIIDSILSFAN